MHKFFNTLLNIFFPRHCISCGDNVEDLCIKCLADSPAAEYEDTDWIFPILNYRHPPIKKAVWLLKYKGKKEFAKIFAETMYPRILEEISELKLLDGFHNPLLVPIPLAPKRHAHRGFNQAELICQNLAKMDGNLNFKLETNILIKLKDTENQVKIKDRKIRLKNLTGSFSIKNLEKNKIKNRNIILIDDVITTGATLTEAKKTLQKAGAKKIIAFTIAH
jgi:ComF family protein